jgi:hypothetical protein
MTCALDEAAITLPAKSFDDFPQFFAVGFVVILSDGTGQFGFAPEFGVHPTHFMIQLGPWKHVSRTVLVQPLGFAPLSPSRPHHGLSPGVIDGRRHARDFHCLFVSAPSVVHHFPPLPWS